MTVAAVAAAAAAGGLGTDPSSASYRRLDKPRWQPPPQAFGPVWTALYADVAVTGAQTLTRLQATGRCTERRGFARALSVNLVLNAGWSWLFFRARRPWAAAADSALLTASSLDLVRRAGRADAGTGRALVPYPAWCAFATALTVAIARRNRYGARPPGETINGPGRRFERNPDAVHDGPGGWGAARPVRYLRRPRRRTARGAHAGALFTHPSP